LRILALGRDPSSIVNADVFLLTDRRPQLLSADPGVNVNRSEPASASLLDDLRADKGMEWMPSEQWLTFLTIDTPAGNLNHDLAASVNPARQPSAVDAGLTAADVLNAPSIAGGRDWLALVLITSASAALLAAIAGTQIGWRRRVVAR
jgi:hypothetical protein